MEDRQGTHRKPVSQVLERFFGEDALKTRTPGLDTGIPRLDGILRGMQPGLVVLGGMTSVGKSTLAIGIGDYICRHGTPVLYYSTEMPADRVTARLITRHHFALCRQKGEKCRFTAADLFDSRHTARWSAADYAAYREAVRAVRGELRTVSVAGREEPYCLAGPGDVQPFHIIDGVGEGGAISAEFIKDDATAFREAHGVAPFVVVDYLQMLYRGTGRAISERQEVDDSIRSLTQLANDGFCVLVVSSISRTNYNKPIQEDAFKESGGIEFSASVLMGLQYTAVHTVGEKGQDPQPRGKKGFDLEQEKSRLPRRIELVVLKNRYGMDGAVRLDYYARYDAFLEEDEGFPAELLPDETGGTVSPAAATMKAKTEPVDVPAGTRAEPAASDKDAADELPEEALAMLEQLMAPGSQAPNPAPSTAAVPARTDDAPAPDDALPRREDIAYGDFNSTMVAQLLRRGEVKPGEARRVRPIKDAWLTFSVSGALTSFDIDVADALYTLHSRRSRRFTLRHLCAVLTGDEGIDIPVRGEAKGLKADVLESLRRLTGAGISIQCGDELEGRGLPRRDFEGPMLSLETLEPMWRYRMPEALEEALPLYAYALAVKQLRYFELDCLHAVGANGRKRSDTRDNVQIKRFLVRKALRMRYFKENKGGQSNAMTISLAPQGELMKLLRTGAGEGTAAQRQARDSRVRETLFWLLDHYSGVLFDGYTVDPKGESIHIV